ncbi:MFS transporter [Fodinicola feengrottensis]|uniref:MFS transporter n=1 Tax=Fodinicola feengrottensis TaxID=435914 RepID=UPI00244289C2|nr:MFS transporter [Fodinicola feengrottensis]
MRKWGPLLAVCLGTTMLLLDVTIVTVALPAMAAGLGVRLSGLQWVIDVYALALAAFLLSAGSLADLLGRRRLFLAGMVIFAVGSLACGLAPTAGLLITARAVQGVGGAAMFATALSLLGSTYQGRDRGTALGVWGAVSGAAAAAGPIVGGVLTESLGWRWIFLVNLPISVVAAALTWFVVRESRGPRDRRIDFAGMVTLTVAASATTYGIITGDANGWLSARTLGVFALAVVGLVAFVVVERKIQHPMLDLRLFGRPAFVGVMLAGFAFQVASFSVQRARVRVDLDAVAAGIFGLADRADPGSAQRRVFRGLPPYWSGAGCTPPPRDTSLPAHCWLSRSGTGHRWCCRDRPPDGC